MEQSPIVSRRSNRFKIDRNADEEGDENADENAGEILRDESPMRSMSKHPLNDVPSKADKIPTDHRQRVSNFMKKKTFYRSSPNVDLLDNKDEVLQNEEDVEDYLLADDDEEELNVEQVKPLTPRPVVRKPRRH